MFCSHLPAPRAWNLTHTKKTSASNDGRLKGHPHYPSNQRNQNRRSKHGSSSSIAALFRGRRRRVLEFSKLRGRENHLTRSVVVGRGWVCRLKRGRGRFVRCGSSTNLFNGSNKLRPKTLELASQLSASKHWGQNGWVVAKAPHNVGAVGIKARRDDVGGLLNVVTRLVQNCKVYVSNKVLALGRRGVGA